MKGNMWLENNLSEDFIEREKKLWLGCKLGGIAILFVGVIGVLYTDIEKGLNVVIDTIVIAMAIFGFLFTFFQPRYTFRRMTPKVLRWGEEGIEYITINGRRKFVSWKEITDIVPQCLSDDYAVLVGISGFPVSEQIGKELKKAWERWQDEQAEIKAREWEEKKNRKARKKWWK
jgi:hypothetical protein